MILKKQKQNRCFIWKTRWYDRKKKKVWFNKTNKRRRRRKKKHTIAATTNKPKLMTKKKQKTKGEEQRKKKGQKNKTTKTFWTMRRELTPHKDFLVWNFCSCFLFSLLFNLEKKKYFNKHGEKTLEPHQFSSHKFIQPNTLINFFPSLFSLLFFFLPFYHF